jgi:hypothetical protein
MLLRIALINLVVFITVANSSSRESESAYFGAVSIPVGVEVFKAEQENKSSIVVCNELDIRFSNYVQRSCRKKIKGISGNNNTSDRMLTGLVFFRRGKKESRFLELVANRTWCVVLTPMAGNLPKFL